MIGGEKEALRKHAVEVIREFVDAVRSGEEVERDTVLVALAEYVLSCEDVEASPLIVPSEPFGGC